MKSFTLPSLLFLLLSGFTQAVPAAEPDPRPTLLVLGGKNTAPFAGDPAWTELVAAEHPGWNVRQALREFLDTNPPPATAALATSILKQTGE